MSSDSPASILFDEFGNPIGVVYDGVTYRLQVQTTLSDGSNDGYVLGTSNHPLVVDVNNIPIQQHVIVDGYVNIAGEMPPITIGIVDQGTPATLSDAWPIIITDGYGNIQGSATNPLDVNAMVTFPPALAVTQATDPWIVQNPITDGYLISILENQTNGTQQVIVDGYVQTNPNVNVTNFPNIQTVSLITAPTTNIISIAASVSNTMLLSSNINRLGATIWNDSSTAILYLKLGNSASTTSYTAQIFPSGYYEVPYNYTGEIDAVWSAAVGVARITEII